MQDLKPSSFYKNIRHVAIILDGNGRWAQERKLNRILGHREGSNRADEIIEAALDVEIPYLSLYVFSTENWNRPISEVNFLMELFIENFQTKTGKLIENRVQVVAQGNFERATEKVRKGLARVLDVTRQETPKMILNLCFSYGGRQEIVDAAVKFAADCKDKGLDPKSLTPEKFKEYLYLPQMPDPDLLIRTGGEHRVSNFLLWQIAYTELYITAIKWPDFHKKDFVQALESFGNRERRYGKTSSQVRQPEVSE